MLELTFGLGLKSFDGSSTFPGNSPNFMLVSYIANHRDTGESAEIMIPYKQCIYRPLL